MWLCTGKSTLMYSCTGIVLFIMFIHYRQSTWVSIGVCQHQYKYMWLSIIYSKSFHTEKYPSDDFILVNDHGLKAKFSGSTGLLKSISVGSTELTVDLDFVSYGTVTTKEKSGAYLFLPDGEAKTIISSRSYPPITITVGPLVTILDSYQE